MVISLGVVVAVAIVARLLCLIIQIIVLHLLGVFMLTIPFKREFQQIVFYGELSRCTSVLRQAISVL